MRKNQKREDDSFQDRHPVVLGIAIIVFLIALGIAGHIKQAKAEVFDQRYQMIAVTHQISARRHIERTRIVDANGSDTSIIGGRPAGCPHAYCGCGLRKYLGIDDQRLNLAWNWARLFPRTHASPGIVAVRRHHVMQLVSHVGGSSWMVRDYNGGRHLSYIHERNVRGYVFVDPSARHMATR